MTIASDVRILSTFGDDEWTSFLQSQPDATLYHTPLWRDFIVEVFGHRPVYAAAAAPDGHLRGVLPLFHVSMPLVGSKLLSLPYDIGSGGALAEDESVERALATHAIDVGRNLKVDYLELRHGSTRPALEGLGLRTEAPALISDMSLDDETTVHSRISSDHRKAVRKASSRGVRVRAAETRDDFLAFYDVYVQVFRDFGTPPYGQRYFTTLHRRLHPGGHVRLFLAELEGRTVGGLMLFCWGQSLVSKFAACLPEAVGLRTYAALYMAAIEFGLANRYRRLSWGTSSAGQAGLIEFKERWGAVTTPTAVYVLDIRGRAPDLAAYYDSTGLAQQVWRRLPLAVTRAGGPWLNRWFC